MTELKPCESRNTCTVRANKKRIEMEGNVMDALEFLKERKRMCKSYKGCKGCPLERGNCGLSTRTSDEEYERIIAAVEQWSKEHPLKQLLSECGSIAAADVALVVHGRWIERRAPHAMGGISAKCSACSKSVQYLGNPLNYCPHCGAKMDIENGRR